MITLYHGTRARSIRPLWTMEELGVPYRLKVIPFPVDPSYADINPTGTVPYFLDGDLAMNESAAICQYLATRYGPSDLAVGPDEAGYGAWLNWLTFGEASMTFPLTRAFRYGGALAKRYGSYPDVAEQHLSTFRRNLERVDAALVDSEYLVADRFTIADISVAYNFQLLEMMKMTDLLSPAAAAYWARLKARPAWARAQDRVEDSHPG